MFRRRAFTAVVQASGLLIAMHCNCRYADGQVCPYHPTLAPPTECGLVDVSVIPQGVNSLGHWVGYTRGCESTNEIPIKWTPETGSVVLPVPPGTLRAIGHGINDSGTVVGVRYPLAAGNDRAFIWLGGQTIEIPGDDGGGSGANAVNKFDWVVGWRTSTERGADSMGFIWRNGELKLIDPRPFGRATATCKDVADSGWVCGHVGGESNSTSLAFRQKEDACELLALPTGAIISAARSIDNSGLTVGYCRYPFVEPVDSFGLPTVWQVNGDHQTLELPPGFNAGRCDAIGKHGAVLGLVYKITTAGAFQTRYVVWLGGKPHFLSDLIEPVSGAGFAAPQAMGDAGHIIGTGGYPGTPGTVGGWLLTPTGSAADLNGDCTVDGMDLALLLSQWGFANDSTNADFDLDGKVDGADLGILLGGWTSPR